MGYIFFTSYTRADRNDSRAFDRFVDYLRKDVGSATGLPSDKVGFHDVVSIRTGSAWQQVLSEGLRTSQVLVLFVSPSYVKSVYCGKELRVFLDRVAAAGGCIEAIFPVLWVLHQPMPVALSQFQLTDDRYPASYSRYGLRRLGELRKHSDDFRTVALELAERIKAARGDGTLPEAPTLAAFDDIESAWEWAPFNLTVIFWHDDGGEWKPFADGDTVVEVVERSKLRVSWREYSVAPDIKSKIEKARRDGDAVLVVSAFETLVRSDQSHQVEQFDAVGDSGCALLLIWESEPPANFSERLRELLPERTRSNLGRHDDYTSVRSAKNLAERIEIIAENVLVNLRAQGNPEREVEDRDLERGSEAIGISVATVPSVSGAGGAQ